jgi:hypothetical protein
MKPIFAVQCTGRYDTEIALTVEGGVYTIRGVVPEKRIRNNVWECNIDLYEYNGDFDGSA